MTPEEEELGITQFVLYIVSGNVHMELELEDRLQREPLTSKEQGVTRSK